MVARERWCGMTEATRASIDEAVARLKAEVYDSAWHDLIDEVRRAVRAVREGRQDLEWLEQRIEALAEPAPPEERT